MYNSSSLAGTSVPILAQATDTERHAFQLLGAAIPLTLQSPEQPPPKTTKTQHN